MVYRWYFERLLFKLRQVFIFKTKNQSPEEELFLIVNIIHRVGEKLFIIENDVRNTIFSIFEVQKYFTKYILIYFYILQIS